MKKEIIPVQHVAQAICFVRGERVLLDFHLARLYVDTTGNLNKTVRRNRERFPTDFVKPRLEIGFRVREEAPPYPTRKRQ